MLSLHETLRLNNEGTALYNANEPSRAGQKLHTSLLGARSLIQQSHPPSADQGSTRCYPDRLSETERCFKDRNGFFLYLRSMVFEEPDSKETSLETLSPVYYAGIVFNLPILHHKHWTEVGSSVFLNKAVVFYQAVLEIIQKTTGHGFYNNPTSMLLVFAANNNLAQIELKRGRVKSFNRRLQYISQFLYSSRVEF